MCFTRRVERKKRANCRIATTKAGEMWKFGVLPFIGVIGAISVGMTGCLDMEMPVPSFQSGPKCPESFTKLMTADACPAGEECQTLADGTICIKRKVSLGGGNGPNCPAGYVTLAATTGESACEFDETKELDDKQYYCTEGTIAGRYCRKIPEDSEKSTVVVREGQMCTANQLVLDDKSLRIHVIDVGQGDAIWIQTPTGQNILVDAGDQGLFNKTNGGIIIADYLAFHDFPEGSTFDAVFVSHPDSDHYGGMKYLFESRYNVKAYIDAADPARADDFSGTYKAWVTTVQGRVQDKIYAPAEQFFKPGDAMPDAFFGPEVEARYVVSNKTMVTNNNRNSMSIIFKISYAGWSMLFTGDAEATQEARAVQIAGEKGVDLVSSNFLKVCHHGSDNGSSTAPFLDVVWPDSIERDKRKAFISSGRIAYSGTYLPSQKIVDRLYTYIPDDNLYSTAAGDGEKEESDATRDDNILIVIKPDGSQYSCYSGVN